MVQRSSLCSEIRGLRCSGSNFRLQFHKRFCVGHFFSASVAPLTSHTLRQSFCSSRRLLPSRPEPTLAPWRWRQHVSLFKCGLDALDDPQLRNPVSG